MRYSKGICWIDDTRIPFVDEGDKSIFNYNSEGINRQKTSEAIFSNIKIIGDHSLDDTRQQGRFTPNLLVCDDVLNDGNITQNNKNNKEWSLEYDNNAVHNYIKKVGVSRFNDKGSNSRYYDLDLWFNHLINKL